MKRIIFYDTGKLQRLFDYIVNTTEEQQVNRVRVIAEEFVQKKRKDYQGNDYVVQIEKNAIYLSEGTLAVNSAMLKYLVYGEPLLRPNEVDSFVNATRLMQSQNTTPFHLAYLRENCDGCLVHSEHARYESWYTLRRAGDPTKYIDELEFSCKYYQATYVLSQHFLSSLLLNHSLAGGARNLPLHDVASVIAERVYTWIGILLGNTRTASANELKVLLPNQDGFSNAKPSTDNQQGTKKQRRMFWK